MFLNKAKKIFLNAVASALVFTVMAIFFMPTTFLAIGLYGLSQALGAGSFLALFVASSFWIVMANLKVSVLANFKTWLKMRAAKIRAERILKKAMAEAESMAAEEERDEMDGFKKLLKDKTPILK